MEVLWLLVLSLAHTTHERLTYQENIELQQTCGEKHHVFRAPSFKILEGEEVEPYDFPFIAAIRDVKKSYQYDGWDRVQIQQEERRCSAVLISKRHILTAAHCVVDPIEDACYYRAGQNWRRVNYGKLRKLEVYVGTRCPKEGPCMPNRTVYEATSVIPHPLYNDCNLNRDIAVIELSRDVDEIDGVPICMPRQDEQFVGILTAIGYGLDPSETTNQDAPGLQVAEFQLWGEHPTNPSLILAVDQVLSLCQGDSGGPGIHDRDGKYTLVGIASSIDTNCTDPAVERIGQYTNVVKFLDWICEHTGVCPVS